MNFGRGKKERKKKQRVKSMSAMESEEVTMIV